MVMMKNLTVRKNLSVGKIEGRRRRLSEDEMVGSAFDSMGCSLSGLWRQ